MSNTPPSPSEFARRFTEAFAGSELPLAVRYSDDPTGLPPERGRGCMLNTLKAARRGEPLALSVDTIACGGGRLYAGFSDPAPHLFTFVSEKERYKRTPELVREGLDHMGLVKAEKPYLNLTRIDGLASFDDVEGLIFFATPDVLSGLVGWALYDTNAPDAVSVPFGSGCSSLISQMVTENRRGGQRCFLGLFDPSARPSVEAAVLGFSIPLSRFCVMAGTMGDCFLFHGHAWAKVRDRIASTAERLSAPA